MIRVLVAHDLAVVRASWRLLLTRSSEIAVIGQGHNGYEAVELARRLQPDVILMDAKMPRLDGLGATRRIVGQQKRAMILIVLPSLDEDLVRAALQNGASGCLSTHDLSDELLPAVLALQAKQPYFGKTIRGRWPHLVNGQRDVGAERAAHEWEDSSRAHTFREFERATAEARAIIDAADDLCRQCQTLRSRAAKTRATSRQLRRVRRSLPPPAA